MSRQVGGLGRSAFFGLFAGLVGSALLLTFFAWRSAHFECESPGTEECMFEETTHADIARLQSYASIGTALIAVGLFLMIRRKPTD